MAMNRQRRTSNLNNILTYDTLGNSTLIANLTVEGLTGAGFVKADAAGLLSVDTAAYTVTTGTTNYLTKITAANTLGQSLVFDNGTSVLVNTASLIDGAGHAFQVLANASGGMIISTTDVASALAIINSSSGNKTWDISPYGNHLVINESNVATRMKFDAGGNITIGDITNTGHKLEIVGSFRTTGTNTLSQLQGVGDRMVVADTNGVLSTQAIPSGSVTSVNTLTGAVTLTTANVSEVTNLYYTDARARAAISLTTTGGSGVATYIGGVLNIPNYTLSGLGGVSGSGIANQVSYWSSASSVTGNTLLTFNGTTLTVNGVSVGTGAGSLATNTALGASSLIANTSGQQNTAVGNDSLRLNTTGTQNSAFGYRASRGNTTGNTNSAFGIDALRVNTIGNNNAAFGAQALDNTTSNDNTAIGRGALLDNTTGANNTALGYRAGYTGGAIANTTGSNNIFIGSDSIGESVSESNRTFIGNTSTTSTWLGGRLLLGSRTDDATNRLQVTGNSALVGVAYVNTNANIAGYGHSLQVLANASGGMIVSTTNTASGIGIINSSSSNKTWDISPFNNDLAINESGVVDGTRMYFSAGGNVLIGSISDNNTNKLQVAGSISATVDSVINGVTIGKGGGSGALNTAVGNLALSANTTGASNTAFGLGALGTITTGSENVAIGTNAGRYRNATTSNSDSSGGVYIGFASRASAAATTNEIVIGSGAQGNGDNTVTIGNTGIVSTYLRGLIVSGSITVNTNGQARTISSRVGLNSNGNNTFIGDGGNSVVGDVGNTLLGSGNVSLGTSNLVNVSTGYYNSSVGYGSLSNITTGFGNTSVGTTAMLGITAGNSNTALGYNAGRYFNPTGTNLNASATGSVYLGSETRASASGNSNEIIIGTSATGNGSNTATLGNTSITATYLRGTVSANGIIRSDASRTAAINEISIALLGSNITTYPASFSMSAGGFGLNSVYGQHEQRFGGDASFDSSNIVGAGLMLNKLAPTAAGTVTIGQASGRIRTMSNLHLMTQFQGNNNLTITHMSGLHVYGHYRTSGSGVLTVSTAYYGVLLADPNEFGAGATVTGDNYGFYQQGTAPVNYFGGKVNIGVTATDGTSKLRISGLPTSSAGLLAGEVWNNGGVLSIV